MCSAPPEDRDSREKHWDCWHYIYGTNSMPVATTLGGLTVLRFKFLTCEVLGRGSPQLSPVTITPTPLYPLCGEEEAGLLAQSALGTYTLITQFRVSHGGDTTPLTRPYTQELYPTVPSRWWGARLPFHSMPNSLFLYERNLATFFPLSTFAMESQDALSLSGLMKAPNRQHLFQSCLPGRPVWKEKALASRAHSTGVGESVSKSSDQPSAGVLPSRFSSPTQNPIFSQQAALLLGFCSCENWLLGLDCLCPSLVLRPVTNGQSLIPSTVLPASRGEIVHVSVVSHLLTHTHTFLRGSGAVHGSLRDKLCVYLSGAEAGPSLHMLHRSQLSRASL